MVNPWCFPRPERNSIWGQYLPWFPLRPPTVRPTWSGSPLSPSYWCAVCHKWTDHLGVLSLHNSKMMVHISQLALGTRDLGSMLCPQKHHWALFIDNVLRQNQFWQGWSCKEEERVELGLPKSCWPTLRLQPKPASVPSEWPLYKEADENSDSFSLFYLHIYLSSVLVFSFIPLS